jgi:hypothetical protein
MLVDEFLPVYEVADAVATDVRAEPPAAWAALMEVDLIDIAKRKPLIGFLGALRALPDVALHLIHGEGPPKAPERMRLRDLTKVAPTEGGWILLGERENEVAFGLVGKFWRPVIEFADVSAEAFEASPSPASPSTSTRSRPRRSSRAAPYFAPKCAWPPRTSTPGAGFAATGPSASAPAPTSSSAG